MPCKGMWWQMSTTGSEVEYLKVPGDHSVAFDRQLHITLPAMDKFFAEKLNLSNTNP